MSIFSAPGKEDFTISDFYAQVANKRPTKALDKDIVVVDIQDLDREGIADLLGTIALCGPRVVGADIMFEGNTDAYADSLLMGSISEFPSIVFPLELKEENDKFSISSTPFFYGQLPGVTYGAANLPGKFQGSTVREMAISFPLKPEGSLESFPIAVARLADPQSAEKAIDRKTQIETIDYPSREFTVIPANEIMEKGELLTDKIVLVGAVNDTSDLHTVPVNSLMSGVMIHAYAVSTILGERFYTPNRQWISWMLAWFLCFFVVLTGYLVDIRVKGLVTRVLQFILVYLAVLSGYTLYVESHIIINFSYTLLMVTFGLFANDIWLGCNGLVDIIRKRRLARKYVDNNNISQ